MGRNAHFDNEQFIDAALKIAAGQGPAAVTIAAVAGEIGAPVGSVYHRFLSRDVLMAEVWLRVAASFQDEFLSTLEKGEGIEAALHTPRWARQHSAEARILLLYRREELVAGSWPEEMKERALGISRRLDAGISKFAARTFGKAGREEINRTVFAIIDVPYAAVLRYIRQGKKPPRAVEDNITKTYNAIMRRMK
ncbi:MAG: TetR/AcrR family transcriptional regulator [Syntrophales bacterium]